jgi:hypothetical protein
MPQLVAGGVGGVPADPPVPHLRADAGDAGAHGDHIGTALGAGPSGFGLAIAGPGELPDGVVDFVTERRGCTRPDQLLADVRLNWCHSVGVEVSERPIELRPAPPQIPGLVAVRGRQRPAVAVADGVGGHVRLPSAGSSRRPRSSGDRRARGPAPARPTTRLPDGLNDLLVVHPALRGACRSRPSHKSFTAQPRATGVAPYPPSG